MGRAPAVSNHWSGSPGRNRSFVSIVDLDVIGSPVSSDTVWVSDRAWDNTCCPGGDVDNTISRGPLDGGWTVVVSVGSLSPCGCP